MAEVEAEAAGVREAGYRLRFRIPGTAELTRMRRLHRDRTDNEVASIDRAQQGAQLMLDLMERGEIEAEDLPAALRASLLARLAPPSADGD